jgi:hypothetical protein
VTSPQSKGNLGNLMQHWAWAEVLTALQASEGLAGRALHVVDAHAMAPLCAVRPIGPAAFTGADPFARVSARLPGAGSAYERVWHALTGPAAPHYPSTGLFTTRLWAGPLALLLCDTDVRAVEAIRRWDWRGIPGAAIPGARGPLAADVGARVRATSLVGEPEVHSGDWRDRFRPGIAPEGDVVIVTFDPDKFDRHPRRVPNLRTMYRGDLELLVNAVADVGVPVFVVLTTYTAQADNSQREVLLVWDAALADGGFERAGLVQPNGNFMAAVYARGAPPGPVAAVEAAVTPAHFDRWIRLAGRW